jgi:sugar phosphate isomerase/epimerase
MIYGATNNPLRPLTDEIKVLGALGFDYLELCLDPPHGLPEALHPRLPEVRAALSGEGLGLPVVHLPTFVSLADIYPSIREASITEVFRALDFAVRIGAEKAVLHPGYLTGLMTFTPDVGRRYAYESLERIHRRATEVGITVCLENMFPRAGHMYRPDEFGEILRQVPGLMMTLDLAHANIRAPKGQIADFVKAAHGRIGHVHVGDNNGREDEHLPVGAGRLDLSGGAGGGQGLRLRQYDNTRGLLARPGVSGRIIEEGAGHLGQRVSRDG